MLTPKGVPSDSGTQYTRSLAEPSTRLTHVQKDFMTNDCCACDRLSITQSGYPVPSFLHYPDRLPQSIVVLADYRRVRSSVFWTLVPYQILRVRRMS